MIQQTDRHGRFKTRRSSWRSPGASRRENPGAEPEPLIEIKMINITKFRHVAIIVKDLQRMLDFYTKIMGFNIKRTFKIESEDFRKGINIPNARAKGAHLIHPNLDIEIELFQFSLV